MLQPPLITYNLRDRGRQHRGQSRNFNINAICDAVNGPACQERIKGRAMLGYFGHKMRVLAGLEPAESVVINGKYNEVEPAIITTYLEAFPDGTIKHQTEFLDNASGRRAAKLFEQRIGGFSSAIDEKRPEFYGFDYVLEPNFNHNRGFSLDSVADLTFDSVLAEAQQEEEDAWLRIIAERDRLIEDLRLALDSATAENEELLSIAASAKERSGHTLDSVTSPLVISVDPAQKLLRDADLFKRTATLPGFIDKTQSKSGNNQDIMDMMGLSLNV